MSTETAPKGASIVSDGALALANDATAETPAGAKLRSPHSLDLPPPRPRLPTLEGLAPPAAIADFDDPTNPDEAEWELTSELRAKPLPSQADAAPTLPSPGLRSFASDERATAPMASDNLDNLDDDDDLDDSDLTSVYVRPDSDDDDEEFNDEETSVAPMPSDAVPTAPKQLHPLLAGPMSRPVPPPPRSTRAAGLPALGVPARPSVLPPPPIGGAARASALPPGLLGMVTRPAAAPPPPPPGSIARPSALLPPPAPLSRAPVPPPPGLRPPSAPPPPGGNARSAVPAPPIARTRSVLPPSQLTRSSAPPPPPVGGGTLPPPPRSSSPPPPVQTAPPAPPGPGWMDHPQNSPFAVRPLTAPVARPSAPPPPRQGSSIAPVALSRESFPTYVKPFGLPPKRMAQLGALALLVAGLLGAVVVLLKQPGAAAGAGAKGDGLVTVTVSGEGGAPLKDLTIVADDVVRCTSSPCKVTDLATGTHFIRVTANGYTATAARAVAVTDDNRPTLHFQLTRIAEPVAATVREPEPAPPQASEPAAPTPPVDLDADQASNADQASTSAAAGAGAKRVSRPRDAAPSRVKSAVTENPALKAKLAEAAEAADEPKAKAKPPVVEEDAAPAALSQLNINSTPSTLIVLDGRPLGKTPISGVKVSPGAHTIVFIGPEGKRKVGTATVKPGATRNIAVKF